MMSLLGTKAALNGVAMSTEKRQSKSWNAKRRMLIASVIVVGLITVGLSSLGCEGGDVTGDVKGTSSGSKSWRGNGSGNNCEAGGTLHWILTPGGNGDLISAKLRVRFADGTSKSFTGYFPGGGGGAMHFDSVGTSKVTSASAEYTYSGKVKNTVLTISHSTCNATTTTVDDETTTTVDDETTTTVEDETTTTVGGATTTTVENGTTTTVAVGSGTSTTVAGSTTSITVVGAATSTTAAGATTSLTAVGAATSTTAVTDPGSPTTVGDLTTAGRIDTGGGGTSGPNVMLWLVVSILGALAVSLGGSAIWSVLKQKDAR